MGADIFGLDYQLGFWGRGNHLLTRTKGKPVKFGSDSCRELAG